MSEYIPSKIQIMKLEGVGRIKFYLLNGDNQINSSVEIISIFVEADLRRKGYGKKLVDNLVKFCKQNNVKYISVKVTKTNNDFQSFLTKNGFQDDSKKIMVKSTNSLSTIIRRIIK